ncbi:MAG: cell division protein SepF [Phascolarctobacterium sp.]|nr:cell division protein SepF [Candidatus Phascolarctobacterium caballi]
MGFGSSTKKVFSADETNQGFSQNNTKKETNVMIRFPNEFNDVQEYAEALINGNIVFLNLENLDGVDRNRVFDYMNGVAYIVNANVDTINESTMLIYAPSKIGIDK